MSKRGIWYVSDFVCQIQHSTAFSILLKHNINISNSLYIAYIIIKQIVCSVALNFLTRICCDKSNAGHQQKNTQPALKHH